MPNNDKFRKLSNIYDGTFLRRYVPAKMTHKQVLFWLSSFCNDEKKNNKLANFALKKV